MVTDLVQNVVKTASNLISDSSEIRQSWSDLSSDELGRAATALLVGLEENAFLLAETVTSEKIIIKPTENIRKQISDYKYFEKVNKNLPKFYSNVDHWSFLKLVEFNPNIVTLTEVWQPG